MSKSDTLEIEKLDLKEPSMYNVIMHNDDFTPMDFVTMVLTQVFNKSSSEAEKIMWQIHNSSGVIVGVYVYEIAEAKVRQTESLANSYKFPLKCTIEESN